MARVFISYSHTDAEVAGRVAGWLVDASHEVFVDHDVASGIRVGEDWQERLHERLRWADAVVCLVSAASIDSTWCVCEVSTALGRGSRVLPLQVEPGVRHPLLARLQHVDLGGDAAEARLRLLAELQLVDVGGGSGWPDDRSPFPGLRPFDVDQHRVFFGRSREVAQLTALLRSPAEQVDAGVLLVVGPSGCGKSSLVRAGLVPAMAAEPGWWTVAPLKPGADPVAALTRELAAALRGVGRDVGLSQVRDWLDRDGLAAVADELLLAAPGPRRTRLLVVIDQLEEVLTQAPPRERSRLARLLAPAIRGPVQVVATLRPEFWDPLLLCPELAELELGRRPFTVRPLVREALPAVIEEPARLAGIGIEDGLVARLVADTDGGEALPLLAYTLEQLVDGVGRGGRLLTSRYEQLGGVQGTLTRQADAALAEATAVGGRSPDVVLRGLLRLVTVDEEGHPTRWRLPRSELSEQVWADWAPFVTRRLLTTDTDDGADVVEVAHEAFLSAWPPLATLIADNATALRAQRRIEQAAAEWTGQQRPARRLWTGDQLAAARADTGARLEKIPADNAAIDADVSDRLTRWPRRRRSLVTDYVALTVPAREFLYAGIRRDRFLRWRITVGLATLLVLALIATAIAAIQLGVAEQQQRRVTAQYLLSQARTLISINPRAALQFAEAAHRLDPTPEADETLLQLLTVTRYSTTLAGHTGPVYAVAFTPDGRTLATGSVDGSVILWDMRDSTRPRRMEQPLISDNCAVGSVAFAPNGRILAAGCGSGSVTLWDLQDLARPRLIAPPLVGHTSFINSVAFAPDGHLLATGSLDSSVILWDVRDPRRPQQIGKSLTGYIGAVFSVAFAPDGGTLATGSADGSVILWDVRNPAQPRQIVPPLTGHTSTVYSVAYSPDGHSLATGSLDGSVILWDMRDPRQPQRMGQPLSGANGWAVRSVAFTSDGRTLASGIDNGSVILWDVREPTKPQRLGKPLTSNTSLAYSVTFAPDGHTLAIGSNEGSVILWDLEPGQPRRIGQPLADHNGFVESATFAPDGHTVALGTYDGTVILWDVQNPSQPHRIGQALRHSGAVQSVAFSPDGHILATGSTDRSIILWDVQNTGQPQRIGEPLQGHRGAVTSVAFSPDGHVLATGSTDHSVILWDVHDPAHAQPIGPPLTSHTSFVNAVAFAPDGHTLATASTDQTVILWDVRDPTRAQRLGPPLTDQTGAVGTTVTFAPDGQMLATAGADQTVILWDVRDPTRPQRIGPPLTGHSAQVNSLAFAPDGQTLATASADQTTLLWNLSDVLFVRDHAAQSHVYNLRAGLMKKNGTDSPMAYLTWTLAASPDS